MINLTDCFKKFHNCSAKEANDDTKMDKAILKPFHDLDKTLATHGKMKKDIVLALNDWFKIGKEKINLIAEVVKILNNSLTILSDTRCIAQGQCNSPLVVNSALMANLVALAMIRKLNHPSAAHIYSEHMIELHYAQGVDIYWKDGKACPTQQQYNRMVKKRESNLLTLAADLMYTFSYFRNDVRPFIFKLSFLLKIHQDYDYHFKPEKYYFNCQCGGKLTYPVVVAITDNPDRTEEIMSLIHDIDYNIQTHTKLSDLLLLLNINTHVTDLMAKLDSELRETIDNLGGNYFLVNILDELAHSS